jgi:hypothetical protein
MAPVEALTYLPLRRAIVTVQLHRAPLTRPTFPLSVHRDAADIRDSRVLLCGKAVGGEIGVREPPAVARPLEPLTQDALRKFTARMANLFGGPVRRE